MSLAVNFLSVTMQRLSTVFKGIANSCLYMKVDQRKGEPSAELQIIGTARVWPMTLL
jgi:hypothetical protein